MARTKSSINGAKQTTTKRSRSDSEVANSELFNLKSPRMEIPVVTHKPMGEKQINSLSSALRATLSPSATKQPKAEKTIREVVDSSDEESQNELKQQIQTKISELKLLRQQTILQQDTDPIFELFWKEKCLPFGWKHEVHDGINVYIRPNAKYIGGERNKDYFFDTRLIMVAVEFANYPPGFIQNIVEPAPVVPVAAPVAPVTTVVKTYSKGEPKVESKEEDNASDVGDHMAVSSVSSDSPKPVVAQASQVVQAASAQASQAVAPVSQTSSTPPVPLPKMDLKDVSFSQIVPKKKISSVLRETWFRQHKIELNYHISIVPPSENPPADKPADAPWVKAYIITITDDDMNTLGAHVVCGKKQVHTLKLKINTVPFHPSQPKTPILGVFFKLLADFRFVASLFLINQV